MNILARKRQERWLIPTFSIMLLFLSAVYLVLFFNTQSLHQKTVEVSKAFRVVNELDLIMSAVRDAESAQRGYIITSAPEYLIPFENALSRVELRQDGLKKLISDRPDLRQRLARYVQLANDRISILKERIESAKSLGHETAIAEYKSGDGLRATERLKAFHDEFRDDEKENHAEKLEEYNESSNTFGIIYIVAAVMTFIAVCAAFFIFRRFLRRQEEDRWIKASVAHISRIIGGDINVNAIGQRVSEFVARQLNALVGNFYVYRHGTAHLTSAYASGCTGSGPERLKIGEGLAGEAIRQNTIKVIDDVPENYLTIQSSLGSVKPRQLLFMPFSFENQVTGVLEAGLLKPLTVEQMMMASALCDVIGVYLNTAINRNELQLLLKSTQEQARALEEQKTRLQESNEQLEVQTAEVTAAKERMQIQQEELRQTNEELEQQAQALEQQKRHLSQNNAELMNTKMVLEEKAKELAMASKYKSEFLANMSHELRTPLNSMLILSTLLIENKNNNLSSQQIDFARTINTAGKDLLNVINDILDLSKVEAGKLDLNTELFDLRQALQDIVHVFEPLANTKGLDLTLDIDDGTPQNLCTDRLRLGQIIKNFVSNAIKFTESGSVNIHVRSVRPEETDPIVKRATHVIVEVKDTGIGIPEQMKAKIFDAFQQVDGSSIRKHGGTGLGLTISRELAHLLGGTIKVENNSDQGSTFALVLPIKLDQPDESANQKPSATDFSQREHKRNARTPPAAVSDFTETIRPSGRNILIVEDDKKFASIVSVVATEHGFVPVTAQDTEEALDRIKSHKPCAIILDIKLPGMSGISLLEKLKQEANTRHIPIHVVSGHDCLPNVLRIGAAGFLAKPASKDDLNNAFSRIETLISGRCKKVLVVEDDRIQREGICHLISGEDIEITSVERGKSAMDCLRNKIFDCMILDLKLPDMSGLELLSTLDSDDQISCPPVIVYTGRDLEKNEEFQLRRYSDSIVLKGARSPERLLDEVALFLHRVETDLPLDQQSMLGKIRNQCTQFNGQKILIVDDDIRNIFALMSALESHGLNVAVSRNGYEALEYLDTNDDIDLVLMDIMMPKMDGFEAMRRIRTDMDLKKLPIIALTAKAMRGDSEKCIEAGASDYLPKPIDLTRLMSLLNAWLPPANTVQMGQR